MLKAEAWPLSDAVPHWQAETRGFRAQARRRYRPSMAQKLDVPGLRVVTTGITANGTGVLTAITRSQDIMVTTHSRVISGQHAGSLPSISAHPAWGIDSWMRNRGTSRL